MSRAAALAALRARSDARASALREAIRQGATVRVAAERLGLTASAIRQLAAREGIALRPDVRLRLVADDRPGVIERRRADCANLGACEVAWIRANGSAQARCPVRCAGFQERSP